MNDKTKQNQFFPHWTWCREFPQLWQNHPSIDLATRKGIISRRLAIDLETVTSTFLWGLYQQNIKKKKQLLEIDVALRKVCTFSGAEEWAAREQLNEIVCAAHLLPFHCVLLSSFQWKEAKYQSEKSTQSQNIKDLEGSSKNPTFQMPGTTHNLYIVDSSIICVKDRGK